MPPKEMNIDKFFITTDDGTKYEIGRPIEPCTLDSGENIESGKGEIYHKSKEFEFNIQFDNLSSDELWLILTGVCSKQEQLMQNNWRRLHGLHMKRRKG